MNPYFKEWMATLKFLWLAMANSCYLLLIKQRERGRDVNKHNFIDWFCGSLKIFRLPNTEQKVASLQPYGVI